MCKAIKRFYVFALCPGKRASERTSERTMSKYMCVCAIVHIHYIQFSQQQQWQRRRWRRQWHKVEISVSNGIVRCCDCGDSFANEGIEALRSFEMKLCSLCVCANWMPSYLYLSVRHLNEWIRSKSLRRKHRDCYAQASSHSRSCRDGVSNFSTDSERRPTHKWTECDNCLPSDSVLWIPVSCFASNKHTHTRVRSCSIHSFPTHILRERIFPWNFPSHKWRTWICCCVTGISTGTVHIVYWMTHKNRMRTQ